MLYKTMQNSSIQQQKLIIYKIKKEKNLSDIYYMSKKS